MRRFFNPFDSKGTRKKLRREATDVEMLFWIFVRNRRFRGLKFYRQFGIDRFIVDFFCPEMNLVIELDGGYHLDPKTALADDLRMKFLEENGLRVLRFWNHEVRTDIRDVFNRIQAFIEAPSSQEGVGGVL